jgi:hypothetical protein
MSPRLRLTLCAAAAVEDLNYRLDLLDADIRHLLSVEPVTHGIATLLKFDQVCPFTRCLYARNGLFAPQLRSSIHHAKAFADFEEHPINFLPLDTVFG